MSAEKIRILLFLVILGIFEAHGDIVTYPASIPSPIRDQCDLRPVEAAIHRLEGHVDKTVVNLHNDIRTSYRRIDSQNQGIQKAVSDCRNDIERLTDRTRRQLPNDPNLDKKLEDLSTTLQLTLAALRLVDLDLIAIKTNLTNVMNVTNTIWDKIDTESSIQKIFNSPPVQSSRDVSRESTPKNCKEIKQKSLGSPSGIYLVQPDSSKPAFMVFCDMVVQNGGWLTIHSRYEGNQDFYLGWNDYKVGFGNIAGEYWLGLEKIYQLTGSNINELLVEVVDPDKVASFAYYSYFSIGSEEEGYSLKVLGSYKGNAGDALSYQAGSKFSTKDNDQDSWNEGNCAQSHYGAWWYKACDKSNLNGRYMPGQQLDQFLYQSMYWGSVAGSQVGLLEARMLIRPRDDLKAGFLPDSA